jgi:hypothetical protein
MMTKGWISRLLEAEELPPVSAREFVGSQLRVPTLDERVSLYLRAVHGRSDFGNDASSEARSLLLDAMAAAIAGKPDDPTRAALSAIQEALNIKETPRQLGILSADVDEAPRRRGTGPVRFTPTPRRGILPRYPRWRGIRPVPFTSTPSRWILLRSAGREEYSTYYGQGLVAGNGRRWVQLWQPPLSLPYLACSIGRRN